jgi:hypothetical protein
MRNVIAHGHIFKNAGSSLDWALSRHYGEEFLAHSDDLEMRQGGSEYLSQFLRQNDFIKAISSHHLCDVSKIDDICVTPMYLLRHPIERVKSVYKFERGQQAKTPGAIAAKEKNFTEYVSWRMDGRVGPTIRNYQSIYLSASHILGSKVTLKSMLQKSLETIETNDCIGIVDRFDESMVVFEEQLARKNIMIDLAYIKQNVTNTTLKSTKQICDEVISDLGTLSTTLIDNNAADITLYQLANMKLNNVIAGIPSFDNKLVDFRKRCAELSSEV